MQINTILKYIKNILGEYYEYNKLNSKYHKKKIKKIEKS